MVVLCQNSVTVLTVCQTFTIGAAVLVPQQSENRLLGPVVIHPGEAVGESGRASPGRNKPCSGSTSLTRWRPLLLGSSDKAEAIVAKSLGDDRMQMLTGRWMIGWGCRETGLMCLNMRTRFHNGPQWVNMCAPKTPMQLKSSRTSTTLAGHLLAS